MEQVRIPQRQVFPTYREYTQKLENAYKYIKTLFGENDVNDVCTLRGYISPEQKALLESMEIGTCTIDDVTVLGEDRAYLGLTAVDKNNTERFLLDGRYIVPIRDIAGNLVALVGWYPDYKKYITTPSLFFSKNDLFFNIDHAYRLSWEKYNGVVFLVEGIFDALSLRAIGLPAIATMGVTVENPKSQLLKLFKKVVAIPDNDKAGNQAKQRGTKKSWDVPFNTTFLTIKGKCVTPYGELKVKDVDNLVSYFEDVKDILLSYAESKDVFEELVLG